MNGGLYESFEGYLVKIKMRGDRTLLLEGREDKSLLLRLVNKLRKEQKISIVIDTVEPIRAVNGITSNREKVEKIHRTIADPARFGAFVDREFREFDTRDGFLIDTLSTHRVDYTSCFWTRGHSTENYFLTPDYLINFLNFWFPDLDTGTWVTRITERFRDFLTASMCLSLFLREHDLFSKSVGILRRSQWKEVGGKSILDSALISAQLSQRGVPSHISEKFAAHYSKCSPAVADRLGDKLRWTTHGHLAWEAVWTGLSHLLEGAGLPPASLEVIERGEQRVKRQCVNQLWVTRIDTVNQERPDDLLQWLRSQEAA